jgi:TatD DNase family protein
MEGKNNIELIDSHAHLNLPEFNDDLQDVLNRAEENEVTRIITVGIDLKSSLKAIELAESFPQILPTVGYHPHEAEKLSQSILNKINDLAKDDRVIAFGEIGLDFFRNRSPKEVQIDRFEDLIQIGASNGLPLIIHDREAHVEIYDRLRSARQQIAGCVIHCFSGDWELAKKFLDLGFYISITGALTFKKADTLRTVAQKMPLDRLLLETDCPFLTPVPKRGHRNEPAYVRYTASEFAKIRGVDLYEIAESTTANAKKLFELA